MQRKQYRKPCDIWVAFKTCFILFLSRISFLHLKLFSTDKFNFGPPKPEEISSIRRLSCVYSHARTRVCVFVFEFVFVSVQRVLIALHAHAVFPLHELLHAEFKIFEFRPCSPACRAIISISYCSKQIFFTFFIYFEHFSIEWYEIYKNLII